MTQTSQDIARRVAARLSPEAARREIAWLTYKIEMDFLQDMHNRPEVYAQFVADALPTLPPDHAAMLALVWEDCAERIALRWDKEEPPSPDREAEIQQRLLALRAQGDETRWYKALRAPFGDAEAPDWQRIYDLLNIFGPSPATVWNTFFADMEQAFREGRYQDEFERRSAGRWPDIGNRDPAIVLNIGAPE